MWPLHHGRPICGRGARILHKRKLHIYHRMGRILRNALQVGAEDISSRQEHLQVMSVRVNMSDPIYSSAACNVVQIISFADRSSQLTTLQPCSLSYSAWAQQAAYARYLLHRDNKPSAELTLRPSEGPPLSNSHCWPETRSSWCTWALTRQTQK